MRRVCHRGYREVARALHSVRPMPRKQRFKPSRKPKAPSAAPQLDDRVEILPSPAPGAGRDALATDENLDPERSR